ncbi:hypothetical protein [Thiolinea disciformis]|uniref:hypothetical protein n=1 Tax=Thiolinea disciformis TaxID=125614 RepID=UPI000381B2B3|nr:hypothetical protein [Thiolinea disciformis]
MPNQNSKNLKGYYELWKSANTEIRQYTETLKERSIDFHKHFPYLRWWEFYELDFKYSVAASISLIMPPDILFEDGKIKTPEKIIELSNQVVEELERELPDCSPEERDIAFSLFTMVSMALNGNLQAIRVFGKTSSISHLIAKAREGDTNALFDAILIDKTCLYTPTAQKLLMKAMLIKDGGFFDQLSRAIKGSRPRKTKSDLDDIRLMEAMMDDFPDYKPLSKEELCNLFIDQLEIYPNYTEDPCGSLWKVIQRLHKTSEK